MESKNPFERFLSLFTEVRAGEGSSAILLTLNSFLIMTSYYLMKPVREALILSGGFGTLSGAVVKSITAAGQVMLLMGLVPLYAMIANRVPRRRLINVVTIFFTGCIALFYTLASARVPLGVVFFVWIGIFNLMIPAQFWAFSNDLYTPEAGKRIFVLIAFGASSGAVAGGWIARLFIEPLGINQLLLVAGALLLLSLILTNVVDSREKSKKDQRRVPEKKERDEPFEKGGAFQLVFKNRYLLMIALLMMFLNWVNTTGEFILGQTVENEAKASVRESSVVNELEKSTLEKIKREQPTEEEVTSVSSIRELSDINRAKANKYIEESREDYVKEYIGKFYSEFFGIVNLAGLLLQLFIVSRILKYLGVRIALLVLPIIALTGYFFIVFYPLLTIIRWAKTAENSTDYSLQNTVRQVLFLPTTREEKYKAKQAIDTFFWRAGDLLSSGIVLLGTLLLAFQIKHFALFNITLIIIWLILAVAIGMKNKKLTAGQTNNKSIGQ